MRPVVWALQSAWTITIGWLKSIGKDRMLFVVAFFQNRTSFNIFIIDSQFCVANVDG